MAPTFPSNLATFKKPEELGYSVHESAKCQSVGCASVNALSSGNNDNSSGSFTRPATDSSLEKITRNPVNDFSGRHSACAVAPSLSIKVSGDAGSTSRHWRSSGQSVDDESPGRNNPFALNSSDNPEDHDATSFKTGAVSETEENIFGDHGPAQSFGGKTRFRDARLVNIANQFEDGSYAITVQLWQLLQDKKRLLQSTTTGSFRDRPAQNTASGLDDVFEHLNDLRLSYQNLLKKVKYSCALIDRIPVGQTEERGVHFQRPGQAGQVKEKLSFAPLCEHFHRRCLIQFSCCRNYYPCHRCHNMENKCGNTNVKAHQATQIKCDECFVEQEINENSQYCSACQIKFSEYFCAKCKHFTSELIDPYHCDKCGVCRVSKDRSFHCDVCNVCLDRSLEGKHECRPGSGHDLCCVCSEDVFSGCEILICSHKVHKACADAAIFAGYMECPFCTGPLAARKAV